MVGRTKDGVCALKAQDYADLPTRVYSDGDFMELLIAEAEKKGITHGQLAEACDVTENTFSHWATGKNRVPASALFDCMRVLDLSVILERR